MFSPRVCVCVCIYIYVCVFSFFFSRFCFHLVTFSSAQIVAFLQPRCSPAVACTLFFCGGGGFLFLCLHALSLSLSLSSPLEDLYIFHACSHALTHSHMTSLFCALCSVFSLSLSLHTVEPSQWKRMVCPSSTVCVTVESAAVCVVHPSPISSDMRSPQ
jgi:hypothetical protein